MPPGPIHAAEVITCVKVPYATEAAALAEARKYDQRVYLCRLCDHWHATKHRNWRVKRGGSA